MQIQFAYFTYFQHVVHVTRNTTMQHVSTLSVKPYVDCTIISIPLTIAMTRKKIAKVSNAVKKINLSIE